MRLLYLYSEEWTGRRAREVHTLSTCVALAQAGVQVTLVTAGGEAELQQHLLEIAEVMELPGLRLVALSRALGPIRSTAIFARNFGYWLSGQSSFDFGYIIHLKAGPILRQAGIPYAYEAHEIFSQTPQNPVRQRKLHGLEGQVLAAASRHIATSAALANALNTWFKLEKTYHVIPNAGLPPLTQGLSSPDGPFVYCGSIADWKGLDVAILAARDAQVPLKIVGGSEEDWRALGAQVDTQDVQWKPRVPLKLVPDVLAGARAGLIPTDADAPSGEFSCPMKLFDYARCGLPVLSTALASLQSLETGDWCGQVPSPTRGSWAESLKKFRYDAALAEAAREWAGQHTWETRAEQIRHALGTET